VKPILDTSSLASAAVLQLICPPAHLIDPHGHIPQNLIVNAHAALNLSNLGA